MIPPYWFLAAILSASALSGWFSHDYTKKGYEKQISEIKLAYNDAMIVEQIRHSNKERKMQASADLESESYFKEKMDNETIIDNLLSSVDSGTKRVYVSTKAGSCGSEVQDSKSSTGTESTNRSELSREATKGVIEVGGECNECAIKYNSLFKIYNNLKRINEE